MTFAHFSDSFGTGSDTAISHFFGDGIRSQIVGIMSAVRNFIDLDCRRQSDVDGVNILPFLFGFARSLVQKVPMKTRVAQTGRSVLKKAGKRLSLVVSKTTKN